MGKPEKRIPLETETMLTTYAWPGNVRELENAVERAMVVGKTPEVLREDLPLGVHQPENHHTSPTTLAEMEEQHIARVLNDSEGNVTRAAGILGIDRVTLYNKIKKYGIPRS